MSRDDADFAFILAELDKLESEAPVGAEDVMADINEHRIAFDKRVTERPGAVWEWNK